MSRVFTSSLRSWQKVAEHRYVARLSEYKGKRRSIDLMVNAPAKKRTIGYFRLLLRAGAEAAFIDAWIVLAQVVHLNQAEQFTQRNDPVLRRVV